jgi:RNA polymerase sigma-70 factor (ECF subfamily)
VSGLSLVRDPDPPPPYADAEAFRALWRAQHGFVWRILARLGVPRAALDDATQEVFFVAYRRRADYEAKVPIRSWLYGIARRVASDVRRGFGRNERRLRAMPSPDAGGDPSDALSRSEAAAIVLAFLETLDEGTRMAFVLMDLEGMSAPEVALAEGVKLNTVYSRLRRARAAFARVVEAHAEGEGER